MQYHLLGSINRGMIKTARQGLETNHQIIRQIRVDDRGKSIHESQNIPRGKRDIRRLPNPTKDKRAFRRMLTSADLPHSLDPPLSVFKRHF